ncbi:unnamed protein product [Mytilus coruscus]|uniref:Uncharacterized protein n=1 Tax=Mytilus coruscus TaxID=42192 RepID=A0A6J8BNT6_MYTCO|nr:unnamed protein product [Mytilus coruscus]
MLSKNIEEAVDKIRWHQHNDQAIYGCAARKEVKSVSPDTRGKGVENYTVREKGRYREPWGISCRRSKSCPLRSGTMPGPHRGVPLPGHPMVAVSTVGRGGEKEMVTISQLTSGTMYQVPVVVQGQNVNAVVDTAAQVTLISEELNEWFCRWAFSDWVWDTGIHLGHICGTNRGSNAGGDRLPQET